MGTLAISTMIIKKYSMIKKPLTEELKYFVNQIGSKVINRSDGKHALDVTKNFIRSK